MIETNLSVAGTYPSDSEIIKHSQGQMSFIPSIKLIQSTSKEINTKTQAPDGSQVMCTAGNFLHSTKGVNLGNRCNIVVKGFRLHALRFENLRKLSESFNPKSPIYKEIASAPDNKEKMLNSVSGWEWLFWVPSIGEFLTFFPGRPSTRPVSATIHSYIKPIAQRTGPGLDLPYTNYLELYSQFENQGPVRKCWVPHVSPLDAANAGSLPEEDIYKAVLEIFIAPISNEAEVNVADYIDDR